MDTLTLKATSRVAGQKPHQTRKAGHVPCVVYGAVKENLHVQCVEKELHRALVQAGESTLVELDVDGKKVPVLFKAVTFHPVTDREMHVDFYAVDMNKEIEAPVPVRFEGESPAVKTEGGIFVSIYDTIRVRCLPAKLPRSFTVSINKLEKFHDTITVADVQVPEGVKIILEKTAVLATIQEPRKEEEVTPVATAAVAADGTAAPAAGAPGAAPAAGAPAAAPAADAKKK